MLYVLLVFSSICVAVETTYSVENIFPYFDYCGGAPNMVRITDNSACAKIPCFTEGNITTRTECQEGYMDDIRLSFGDDYIFQKVYAGYGCTTFSYAIGYRVTDTCALGYYESEGIMHLLYYMTRLDDDGSARIAFFSDSDCAYFASYDFYIDGDITTKYAPNNDDCMTDLTSDIFPGYYRWYTRNQNGNTLSSEISNQSDDGDDKDDKDDGLNGEIITCIVCASILLVLVIAAFIIAMRERKRFQEQRENSLVVTVTLDSAMDVNEILHYDQPDEAEDGVQFATLVETLQS